LIIDHVGADRFIMGDGLPAPRPSEHVGATLERFVAPLSAETRAKLLGRNVARLYDL
jgi:predicted TIM-barrel fold metal-dependent hydrolase